MLKIILAIALLALAVSAYAAYHSGSVHFSGYQLERLVDRKCTMDTDGIDCRSAEVDIDCYGDEYLTCEAQ